MEVEATVKIMLDDDNCIEMTMEQAKELKAKLDAVVPRAPVPPFTDNPYHQWVERFNVPISCGGNLQNDDKVSTTLLGSEVDKRG